MRTRYLLYAFCSDLSTDFQPVFRIGIAIKYAVTPVAACFFLPSFLFCRVRVSEKSVFVKGKNYRLKLHRFHDRYAIIFSSSLTPPAFPDGLFRVERFGIRGLFRFRAK